MQVVPSHVCREIDRLVGAAQSDPAHQAVHLDRAYEAVHDAIGRYFDKTPVARFHCLWLFHRGAAIAEQAGRPQVALAYLQRFIADAEALSNQGPHEQQVTLKHAQIRPPRLDEIAAAKARLPQVERRTFELLKENLPGKTDDEIRNEVERCRLSLTTAQKSGPCFVATAAQGNAWAPEVQLLRDFRDGFLVTTLVGRWIVALYSFISPPIARRVRADRLSGAVVRTLLRPLLHFLVRRGGRL